LRYLAQNKLRLVFVFILLVLLLVFVCNVFIVRAADLSDLSDQMSRIKVSTLSNHTIEFTTPSGIAIGETITIKFPVCFSIPGTLDYTDVDLEDDSVNLNLAGSCSGATWGVSISGQIITLTSCTGAIAGGSKVTVEIGNNATHQVVGDQQITNCNLTDTIPKIQIQGTMADNGNISLEIISEDQIPVTGVLIPALTFVLNTTPLNFGLILDDSIAGAGPNTIVLSTNSPLGYTITVRDIGNGTSAGLWNSAKNHLISSITGLLQTGVSEGYGGQCTKVSGSGSCHANFAFTGDNVGDFTRTNQTFASFGAQPAGVETYTITVKTAIISNTPSGQYFDRLTFVATAMY